ncbi:hypothetical protein [Wohlfahrtiimonas chitiniclastica]|uniref:hypothetical protein n=1 Tax=Wohlfahrtiimonas chitiniclastica TaxID=400946 RepID=UPI000B99025F|nr:hypothetical protein [Wohlfahrtiimonas chitiniclastica]OYQ76088.1 hypothetical protein B9T18_01655 [Wohlfahrtiimonas chitiniclastica]
MPEILKNIKAEDRLKKIRIVSENDDVMGGQPEADGMKENDNNAIFDLACSVMHALAEVAKVDQKAIPQILDALGDSRTAGASQRIVNEVNKLAKAAQTAANQANDKANMANTAAATADKKAVAAQNRSESAYSLAYSKQDKLQFVGSGDVMRSGAWGLGSRGLAVVDSEEVNKFFDVNIGSGLLENFDYCYGIQCNHGFAAGYKAFLGFGHAPGNIKVLHFSPEQKLIYHLLTDKNTNVDANGFIRSTGNKTTVTTDDIANELGSSSLLIASQQLVNSINTQKRDRDDTSFYGADGITLKTNNGNGALLRADHSDDDYNFVIHSYGTQNAGEWAGRHLFLRGESGTVATREWVISQSGIKLGPEQLTRSGYKGYSEVPENCVITRLTGFWEGGGNVAGAAYYRPIINL